MSIAYDNSLDADRHSAVVLRRQLLIDGQHVESASGKNYRHATYYEKSEGVPHL